MTLGNSSISFNDIVIEQRGVTSDSHTLEQLSNIAGFWSPASSNIIPPFKLSYFKGYKHITGDMGVSDSSSTTLTQDILSPLASQREATIQVLGEFTNSTNGIIYDAGGSGDGLILYIYNQRIYGQCGAGSGSFGQDSTFECSYLIPNGVKINEIVFTANCDSNQSNLYVNGYNNPIITTLDNVGAMSNVSTSVFLIAGNNDAGWGKSYEGLCMNRAGWANSANQGPLTNALFTKGYIWNTYMQGPPPPPPAAPYTMSAATLTDVSSIGESQEMRLTQNGDFMYVLRFSGGLANEYISLYSLSTPFDITTKSLIGSSGIGSAGRPFALCGVIHDTEHTNYGKLMYSMSENAYIVKFSSATPFVTPIVNEGVVAYFGSSGRIYFADLYDNGNKLVIIRGSAMYIWNISDYVLTGIYHNTDAIFSDTNINGSLGFVYDIVHFSWVANGNYVYAIDRQGFIRLFNTTSAPYDYSQISNSNFIEQKDASGADNEYSFELNRNTSPELFDIGILQKTDDFFKFTFAYSR